MRRKAIYILDHSSFEAIYGPGEQAEIARLVDVIAGPQTREAIRSRPSLLRDVEIVLSGWGGPRFDEAFLDAAPRLRGIFYGAGSMGHLLTPAVWERDVAVTSALGANAIPVAEYTLGTILFSLKHGWALARQTRERRTFVDRDGAPGCYGSTIGLIGLGATARHLLELLRPFSINVLAYDPFLTPAEAERLRVRPASLPELFASSDVVSLHAPLLAETVGMVGGALLGSMRPGSTFINTARATIVRQDELIDVAVARPDLQFVLDVADPEPPAPDCPLYTLANVVLTPHIAGSVGQECRRMGRYMAEELDRFLDGRPLRGAVTRESAMYSSHRHAEPTPPAGAGAAPGRPDPADAIVAA